MTKARRFLVLCFVLLFTVLAVSFGILSKQTESKGSPYRQEPDFAFKFKNFLCAIGVADPPQTAGSFFLRCRANLKQIDGATEQWALENRKSLDAIPTWSDLVGTDKYIKHMPLCPAGGIYTLGSVTNPPTCTMTNDCYGMRHTLPEH